MVGYANIGGNSNVVSYEIGTDYIDVLFSSGRPYRYSYKSAGSSNVERMKILAKNGQGLNAFINKNVKYLYEK
jgi:ABC-type Zn2+ transport system substrate-binding protein/surface adhesin